MKKAAIIIIGNELLTGKIADKNTKAIAKFCFSKGIKISQSIVIGDDRLSFKNAYNYMNSLPDVETIFICGGLGPTKDDLTKEMIIELLDDQLIYREDVAQIVKSHYEDSPYSINLVNHPYCFFPKKATPLFNSTGYAPGIYFELNTTKNFSLPGVPNELQAMLEVSVSKYLQNSQELFENIVVKTKGCGESQIFTSIDPLLWNQLQEFGEVSSLPHSQGVDIGVFITAKNLSEIQKKKNEIFNIISNSPIHSYVWSFENKSIEELIIKNAFDKKLTISFAESCTGGLCSHRLTSFSGSSQAFWGSVIAYDNSVKTNSLNVKSESLKAYGAVSEAVAKEMAIGVKKLTNTSIGVSLTGICGPLSDSTKKPVGLVYIGLSTKKETLCYKFQLKGNRLSLKEKFSQLALFLLLDTIKEY